jgi:hypothetical protein
MTSEMFAQTATSTTNPSAGRVEYSYGAVTTFVYSGADPLFGTCGVWPQQAAFPSAALIYQVPHRDEVDLIEKFRAMEADWDGYDANKISDGACDAAKNFIANLPTQFKSPELCPNPSGTISMEWDSEGGQAQLELGKRKFSFYLRKNGIPTIYQNGEAQMAMSICGLLSLLHGTPRPAAITNITY